jgi:glycosyltransferase involved in cell wall biosynthesis
MVATTSYAGMGPYVVKIVNETLAASRMPGSKAKVHALMVDDTDNYYQLNIDKENLPQCTFVPYANNKLHKLRLLISPPRCVTKALREICVQKNIDVVHFISGDALYASLIEECCSRYKTFLTVHDTMAHDAKKSWHKMLRMKIIYDKYFKSISIASHLITNSHTQANHLKAHYPDKAIYYLPFPTLVTPRISHGKLLPNELKGVPPYILFFGRIEKYKGVDVLYEAFKTCEPLKQKYRLVIAGSGELSFVPDPSHTIFINRYIADEEVAELFRHAACVVFPYISATQSGVLSLACYFQTPTIVSDVPFFMEHVSRSPIALTFSNGSVSDLQQSLIRILNTPDQGMLKAQVEYYETEYRQGLISDQLIDIYTDI